MLICKNLLVVGKTVADVMLQALEKHSGKKMPTKTVELIVAKLYWCPEEGNKNLRALSEQLMAKCGS